MRKKGASLNEITKILKSPKSTVRYWCRDILLSDAQQKRLYNKQKIAGIKAGENIRRKRISITRALFKEGVREIGLISKRDLWLIGTALYWAEGYRKGNGEFGFTNSDPNMIKVIIDWLLGVCNVEKERIHLRVCVNSIHKKRINEIQKFWSKTTGVHLNQFSKPTLINITNKKIYYNSSKYFGTLRIKVRKSTNLRRKIMGWIGGLIRGS